MSVAKHQTLYVQETSNWVVGQSVSFEDAKQIKNKCHKELVYGVKGYDPVMKAKRRIYLNTVIMELKRDFDL